MTVQRTEAGFSDGYARLREEVHCVEERAEPLEAVLQERWRDGLFPGELTTLEGHRLQVLSPGWWNRLSGPDFTNAQVSFNGKLYTGDVEIHCRARDWFDHGHHKDPAYNDVVLHVVRAVSEGAARSAVTAAGRQIATLVWAGATESHAEGAPQPLAERCGECATALVGRNPEVFQHFIELAGEWRVLEKSRRIRERMREVGGNQAFYEAFMTACGYGNFKTQFQQIAKTLSYDRAQQLARQDPLALEAALLRIAGLLPESWPDEEVPPPPYYQALLDSRRRHLSGLGVLPLEWQRIATRPANFPERRIAGAARFLARTADKGLQDNIMPLWRMPATPIKRRRMLEDLFGGAVGFWADHFTWTGKEAARRGAPLGAGRIRAIIGNIMIPAALAWARNDKDRRLEENVHELFRGLPSEPENRIHRTMRTWLRLENSARKLNFRKQQGLLQIHEDWCAFNPSCRNCTLLAYMRTLDGKADG